MAESGRTAEAPTLRSLTRELNEKKLQLLEQRSAALAESSRWQRLLAEREGEIAEKDALIVRFSFGIFKKRNQLLSIYLLSWSYYCCEVYHLDLCVLVYLHLVTLLEWELKEMQQMGT
jgi:hypothetical protein